MNNFKQSICQKWETKGFTSPTRIQELAFEEIKTGNSVVLHSPTGSGKTLAYLLPVLNRIEANNTLQCLVLVPSQELAAQIFREVSEWSNDLSIKVQLLAGGANIKRQIESLKDKPEIIVATPGRFLEVLDQSRKLKLHLINTVIFDEADYLFSDEHQASMGLILKKLMRDTQIIWASATIGNQFKDYIDQSEREIKILEDDEKISTIDYYNLLIVNRKKIDALRSLAYVEGMRSIIFCEHIFEIEEIEQKLTYNGIPVVSLHSQMNNMERKLAIQAFESRQAIYLVTTDVASRGLDLKDVPFVIHYNLAPTVETYIHRSGRTGRMGKHGTVISLLNEQESRNLQKLLQKKDIFPEEVILKNNQLILASEIDNVKPTAIKKNKKRKKTKK